MTYGDASLLLTITISNAPNWSHNIDDYETPF